MEDTMTNSSQNFWFLNKYGLLAVSLASAVSVNASVQKSIEGISADSCISIQTGLNNTVTFGADKTYSFPTKKNFRDRYKRIAQSEWFEKTHSGMSIGEIITIEE